MGVYNLDDILALDIEYRGIVCHECWTEEDEREIQEDEIITIRDVENSDKIYCCDNCGKRL